MNNVEKRLIGKTITKFDLAEDGYEMKLFFKGKKNKPLTLVPVGDCCSRTWIENIEYEDALIGSKITAIEQIEMPDLGNIEGNRHKDVDQVSYYGLKITTGKGVCVIDYRNDSNGYYGGWLVVK